MEKKDKLNDDLFKFTQNKEVDTEVLQGSSLTFWQDAKMRFTKNKAAVVSLFALIVIFILAFTAPFVGGYHNKVQVYSEACTLEAQEQCPEEYYANLIGDYTENNNKFLHPGGTYVINGEKVRFIFGTDELGRDLYVRTMVGALVSISFGLIAALIDLLIGVTVGAIAGFYGGKFDFITQRIAEILGSVPLLIWVMMIIVFLGTGMLPLILALVISGWIPMYRIVRAQVMKLKTQEYVLSARTLGQSKMGIIFKHILPNSIGVIIIWLMFSIPSAIFFESFMSFLGLGITAPIPSLGSLASTGKEFFLRQPYLLLAPAMVLSLIMLTFNLIADGLRDAFDPKMRGGDDE